MHHYAVVVVIAPDERSAEITIEGRTSVIQGETARQVRSGAIDAAASYAAHLGRSVLVNATDANGSWQLSVSPSGVVQTVGGDDSELTGARQSGSGKGRRILLGTAAGVLVLTVLGGAGYYGWTLLAPGGGEPGSDGGGPAPFTERPVPPGFAAEAAWSHPMAQGSDPAVAPDGSAAAFLDPDDRLTVIGPDGTEQWSEALPAPAGDLVVPPYFIADPAGGEGYAIALASAETLWTYSADGGEPVATEIADGARVSYAGRAPMVEDGGDVFVPDGSGDLVEVAPSERGYGAMLYDGERVLTAVVDGPWIWESPGGGAPEEVAPEVPQGAGDMAELLTARAEHVVVLWEAGGGDSVVAVHDAADGAVLAQAAADEDDLAEARWVYGDTVAAYGPIVFDLEEGGGTDTGMAPVSASGGQVYGELDGGEVVVDASGETQEIAEGTAKPWGLLDGHAVVVAGGTAYGLTPE
ncbi:hypothetical protein GCM10027440_40110 [Nocardiopsis coralliicola]